MNRELNGKIYKIPQNILEFINLTYNNLNDKNVAGVERAQTLLNKKTVTYDQLKRIIHDIKTLDKDTELTKYNLYGGILMERWAKLFLDGQRLTVKNIKGSKTVDQMLDRKNSYIKTHEKKTNHYYSTDDLKVPNNDTPISSLGLFEEIQRMKKIIKY